MNIAKKLVEALREKKKPSAYDSQAVVNRIENGTAWVRIYGGIDETPVQMSIDAEPGDIVNVRVSGGKAWITGNNTAPPTDDKTAKNAMQAAKKTNKDLKVIEHKIENGDFDGKDGRSVTAVITQYCLANANAIPVGQTFEDIQYSQWQTTIPTYVGGKYYWMRLEIHYSDGTVEYNDPIFDLGTQVSQEAEIAAREAASAAEDAEEIAQAALDGVGNISNHFWADSTGVHVAENEGTVASGASQTVSSNGTVMMRNGKLVTSWTGSGSGDAAINFYDCSNASARTADLVASYGRAGITQYINNIVAMALTVSGLSFYSPDSSHDLQAVFGSSGINLYAAGKLAMALAAGQLTFYDSDGITPITTLGAAQEIIGKLSGGHVVINATGAHIYKGTDEIAHLGYDTGKAEGESPDEAKPYFTIGSRGGNLGNFSVAVGYLPVASGYCAYASGVDATASGDFSRAEGFGMNGAGDRTEATGVCARAAGRMAQATDDYAHAEGEYAEASGKHSYAKGVGVTAEGDYSHAEGVAAVAEGDYSHAEGTGTKAEYDNQTVFGKYNEVGVPNLFAVGNGTSDYNRSTAMAVDLEGNIKVRGKLYINCGADSTGGTSIFDAIYPVGAIYMSVNSTSPATLFGGTWERITGKFLLSATDGGSSGASQAAGRTGGSADAIVPYHKHSVKKVSNGITGGSHEHVAMKQLAEKVGSGTSYPRVFSPDSTTSGTTPRNTSSESHNHDLPAHDTEYVGTSGNTAGANMPPYLAVYVWKRTA